MDLVDAFLVLGNALQLLPENAISEADRIRVIGALEELVPALVLASSNALERFDMIASAKYANASARLAEVTRLQGARGNPEAQSLKALAEVVKESVQRLYERNLDPIEASKLLDLVNTADAVLLRK